MLFSEQAWMAFYSWKRNMAPLHGFQEQLKDRCAIDLGESRARQYTKRALELLLTPSK